jgi:hypothetical protein
MAKRCFFFPLGAAAVLAQFKIDQFRSIAWFNVAFGVAFIILEVIIFRGESNFKKLKSRCTHWKFSKCSFKPDAREIAISSLYKLVCMAPSPPFLPLSSSYSCQSDVY